MAGIPSKALRESLFFGAAVALAGLVASLGALVVGNVDASRDAHLLAKLSSASSIEASDIETYYPKTGSRKIFIMKTASGTKYGTLISLSSPSYSGLVAATFSANGRLDSLKPAASMRPAWQAAENEAEPSTPAQGATAMNLSIFVVGPMASFDPTGLELGRSLAAISQSVAEAANKEGAR